jgi:hypothetical protein
VQAYRRLRVPAPHQKVIAPAEAVARMMACEDHAHEMADKEKRR